MELLPFLSRKKSEDDRYFLALVITNATVQAGLWRVSDSVLSIDSLSDTRSYTNDETMLVATDAVLQKLGKNSEKTDEVVFGFELDWVDETGISDAKKPLLKHLTTELSLKPAGFVVIPEALLHTLQKEDPQCSVLLVQLAVHQLTVTLIKQGVLLSSERVGRSKDVVLDVTEAMARFNEAVLAGSLPGKIIIAGIGIKDEIIREKQQDLLKHAWADHHQFIHPPVIEMLSEDMVITSVIQEGGKAVVESQGLSVEIQDEKPSDELVESLVSVQTTPQLHSDNLTQPFHTQTAMAGLRGREEYALSADTTGGATHTEITSNSDTPLAQDESPNRQMSQKNQQKRRTNMSLFHFLFTNKKVIFGGFAAGLVALSILALVTLFISKRAVVMVMLKQEFVSKDIAVTLDSQISQSKPEELLLKATTTTKQLSGNDSIAASGIKLVGEKAKGTVTLFNKTDSPKKFTSGTELKNGQLRFVLDQDVEVASSSVSVSSSDSETKVFGKADVSATASLIGANYNIAKEQEMQVGDFTISTYAAKSKDDFTGGSSREVRVVSQEDKTKVLKNVQQILLAQATEEFKESSKDGISIIPTGKTKVLKATYDAEIGEEVSSLTLDLELEVEAVAYSQEDMKALLKTVLASEIPAGYTLSDQDPSILTDSSQKIATDSVKTRIDIALNVSSQAIPVLNTDTIKSEIAGKVLAQAQSMLNSTTGILESSITIYPWPVRLFQKTLPKNPQSITVEIQENGTQ